MYFSISDIDNTCLCLPCCPFTDITCIKVAVKMMKIWNMFIFLLLVCLYKSRNEILLISGI